MKIFRVLVWIAVALAGAAGVEFHRSADDLSAALAPDAVVFAVKPQNAAELLHIGQRLRAIATTGDLSHRTARAIA